MYGVMCCVLFFRLGLKFLRRHLKTDFYECIRLYSPNISMMENPSKKVLQNDFYWTKSGPGTIFRSSENPFSQTPQPLKT